MINIKYLIEKYILNLKKEDILYFAKKNNLSVTEDEINFTYNFIKNNYKSVLNDPKSLQISKYKNNYSKDNYLFIENIYNKYIGYIK